MTQGTSGSSSPLHGIASGDFIGISGHFEAAGFDVALPATGIFQVRSRTPGQRPGLLLSAGIHGDETAPIEMLEQLLVRLAETPLVLAVDLMVVIGNLAAIAAGQRYIDVDINRLFGGTPNKLTQEASRAALITQETAAFMEGINGPRWHLDLHTAIRESNYPTFAIVPAIIKPDQQTRLIDWLGGAGIGAVIINHKPAGTYSAYTATQFGAVSATVELGRVGQLGMNDLSMLARVEGELDKLLRSGQFQPSMKEPADVFLTRQELVKLSDDFCLAVDRDTKNFTPVEQGTTIAQDGEKIYRVGDAVEYIVFPNPDVQIGQRAGLMVVRRA